MGRRADTQGHTRGKVEPEASVLDGSPLVPHYRIGEHHRVHPSYIFLAPIAATIVVLAALGITNISDLKKLYDELDEEGLLGDGYLVMIAAVALIVIYIILVVIYLIRYRNLSFVFEEDGFSLCSGFLFKHRVRIPYGRIQSVNHIASLIQRLVGVCVLAIHTAGGEKNTVVRVPYIRLETYEHIREDLAIRRSMCPGGTGAAAAGAIPNTASDLISASDSVSTPDPASGTVVASAASRSGTLSLPRRINGRISKSLAGWRGANGGKPVRTEPASYEFGLTASEIFLASISRSSTGIMSLIGALAGSATAIYKGYGIGAVIFMVVLFWLCSVISLCISSGRYRVRRVGDRIEVERGLFRRESGSIPVDRIQSVVIRRSPIRCCLGCSEITVSVVDAAKDQSTRKNTLIHHKGLVVHPFIKTKRVDEVLARLLPEFAVHPQRADYLRPAPAALLRAVVRKCVLTNLALLVALVFVAAELFLPVFLEGKSLTIPVVNVDAASLLPILDPLCLGVYIACALFTVGCAVSALIWKKGSGFAADRDFAVVENDGLRGEKAIIPISKMQCVYTNNDPFQRNLHLTSIVAVTAAGTDSTSMLIFDLPEDSGRAWVDWLVSGGLQVPVKS